MTPRDLIQKVASNQRWDRIVIASAYLDSPSVDLLRQILRTVGARRAKRLRPMDVIVLTGMRDGLTRVSTLKKLLVLERRPPPRVRLTALCPRERRFHAKAYLFVRAERPRAAIVGSCNWTRPGLDGLGECWVHITENNLLTSVAATLRTFERQALPWTEAIATYHERPIKGAGGAKRGQARIVDTAPTMNGLVDLGSRTEQAVDAYVKKKGLRTVRPRIPLSRYVVWEDDGDTGVLEERYLPGAWFDADWHDEGWAPGARRQVARVAFAAPYPRHRLLVFRRQIVSYRVTPRIAQAAKQLGIRGRGAPSQRNMQRYLQRIRRTQRVTGP